jgi:hypothetical protein
MKLVVSQSDLEQMMNDYEGLCLACGEQSSCVEPDAENYECEVCGESMVYGAEQLVIMGKITVGP